MVTIDVTTSSWTAYLLIHSWLMMLQRTIGCGVGVGRNVATSGDGDGVFGDRTCEHCKNWDNSCGGRK